MLQFSEEKIHWYCFYHIMLGRNIFWRFIYIKLLKRKRVMKNQREQKCMRHARNTKKPGQSKIMFAVFWPFRQERKKEAYLFTVQLSLSLPKPNKTKKKKWSWDYFSGKSEFSCKNTKHFELRNGGGSEGKKKRV